MGQRNFCSDTANAVLCDVYFDLTVNGNSCHPFGTGTSVPSFFAGFGRTTDGFGVRLRKLPG